MGDVNVVDLVRARAEEMKETQTEVVQTKSDGIWIPIPHDELPSRGIGYSEQLVGRPLGATEVKKLSGMNSKNAPALTDAILRSCVSGVPFEKIYLADKMYLLFWLRQNTYKRSDYQLTYECTECESSTTSKFALSDLSISQMPEDVDFNINVGDKVFTVKYRTVADQDEVDKFMKKNQKNDFITFDEDWIELASSIVAIDGQVWPLLRKYQYLIDPVKFTADDYSELNTGIDAIAFGVSPTVKVKCSKCGGYSESLIPFRPDYFLPKSNPRRNM